MWKTLKVVSINIVVVLVGIVLLELIFGGWRDPNNLNRLHIARDIESHRDISWRYDSEDPIIIYSRDKYGLRGDFSSPEEIDILTVGGSTTDQQNIADGSTWQDVIEGLFSADGASIVVANAGRDGQSSYGHIKNFKWWFPEIPGLAPSHILYYVGINDFRRIAGFKPDKVLRDNPETGVWVAIRENSAIYTAFRAIHGAFRATVIDELNHSSVDFDEVEWTSEGEQDEYGFMDDLADRYAERLSVLADLTYEMGATPIFVSQPVRRHRFTQEGIEGITELISYWDWKVNGVDYYYMLRKLDSKAEQVARNKNAYYIDLGAYNDWEDGDFYDYFHMTPKGATKVGERMYRELKKIVPGDQ